MIHVLHFKISHRDSEQSPNQNWNDRNWLFGKKIFSCWRTVFLELCNEDFDQLKQPSLFPYFTLVMLCFEAKKDSGRKHFSQCRP